MSDQEIIENMNPEDLVIKGKKPGAEPEPAPQPKQQQQPSAAEITVNGVKYSVTPELAKAIREEQDALDAEKQRLQSVYTQQNQPVAPPSQSDSSMMEKGYKTVGDRIFEDPDAVLQEFEARIEKKLENKYMEAEAQKEHARKQQEGLDKFYSDFQKANKDLKDDMPLVKAVLQANFDKWAHLTPEKVADRLADAARETILRHTKREQTPDLGVVFEDGGQPTGSPEPAKKADDDGPKSLSDVIKLRRKARAEGANFKTPKA
jgi:hypothetical protein